MDDMGMQVNPRSLEGGGGQIDPPPRFFGFKFLLLDWHNCSLFVNTSFDTN